MKNKPTAEEAKFISQLEMQAIFYWIHGAIGLFVSFFLFIYGVIFGLIFFNDVMRELLGSIGSGITEWIAGIYISIFVLVFTLAILHIIQGFKLYNRRNHGFSVFVAYFSLISFPLGTVLGIFSLLTLNNPIVKELYEHERESRMTNF